MEVGQSHREWYNRQMARGASEYADVIKVLETLGLPTIFTQTGGMNAALEVQLETGETLLVTDYEDVLPWERSALSGWAVGRYQAGEAAADGAVDFASTPDTSLRGLVGLIDIVLSRTQRPRQT